MVEVILGDKRGALIRSQWGRALLVAAVLVLISLDGRAQGVYRHVDEKGKVTFTDVPPERKSASVPQPVQPTAPQAPTKPREATANPPVYDGGKPVIDYTGRYSEVAPYGFSTSGKKTRSYANEKTLDQRIDEQNARQREMQKTAQAARERAIEQDRQRVEREARQRVENDKRKLRELQRENDSR